MHIPTINCSELKHLIETHKHYTLIDVRELKELQNGMIPTAHHIPLGRVEKALDLQPSTFAATLGFPKMNNNDPIIFYCRTGSRSAVATTIALSKGYPNAKNLAGGIWDWSIIDPNVRRYDSF